MAMMISEIILVQVSEQPIGCDKDLTDLPGK